MNYSNYVISTIGYGIFAILGLLGVIYFGITKQFTLFFLGLAVFGIALDNFFCGSRAKKHGFKAKSLYVVPSFLRKK